MEWGEERRAWNAFAPEILRGSSDSHGELSCREEEEFEVFKGAVGFFSMVSFPFLFFPFLVDNTDFAFRIQFQSNTSY